MDTFILSLFLWVAQNGAGGWGWGLEIPLPAGWGTANPVLKGVPVVIPAGFSSLTPYVVREVIRLTRSFKASLDSASFACSI